jgi:toxin ParE1/3/4
VRVIWLATAADDRRRIFDFLLERNPQAALEVEAELLAAAAGLDRFPLRGRTGLVEGTRELVVVRPYILI